MYAGDYTLRFQTPMLPLHLIVMGFFESLATFVFVERTLDPFLTIKHGADVMGEISVLAAVPRRETHLDCKVSPNGIEVVGGPIVYLALMVVNPAVVPQGMNERTAVAIRESDATSEGGAVWIGLQCLQNTTNVVGGHHVIIVHESDILPSGLGQEHVSLLTNGHMSTVRDDDELDFAGLLGIEAGVELFQTVLAIGETRDEYREFN